MAQSYQEYIKSLSAGGSTKAPTKKETSVSYGLPISATLNTNTANSTPQTPAYNLQEDIAKMKPYGSSKMQNQTFAPVAPTQSYAPAPTNYNISSNTPGVSPNPISENVYRTLTQPFGSQVNNYGVSDVTPTGTTAVNQPKTLSAGESSKVAADTGLKGIVKDSAYTGLTMAQAQEKANADKALRQGQVSANTSYTFNPQSISGFNKKFNDMKIGLDTIKNDAFTSSQQKKTDTDSTLRSYTNQFAGLFSTPEEFQSALSGSPEIQKNLQEYQQMGGSLSDIATAIQNKTSQPSRNTQSLDQYLGRMSTPAEQKAYDSLLPEKQAYQDQITFEQSIPNQYKDLYFGTPERMGVLEQQRNLAVEKAQLLETQAQMAKDSAKIQSELLIQKNAQDLAAEEATVEENRMNAKNYVTGMLAKLGALNTTGAAVEGLANLEQKYQRQSQQLKSSYNFRASQIQANLNDTLNEKESAKLDAIYKVKEDLSKSEEEIAKEVFKLETTAQRETFKITDKYLSELRGQKEKYVKEAKAQAEKNAKLHSQLVSNYNLSGLTFPNYVNQRQQGGEPTTIGGNSIIGGMQVPQGGQTFANPKSLFPDYLQALQGKNISDDLKAVLAGEANLSDFTPTNATKIQRELTKLGIKKADLPNGATTDEVGKLSNADLTKGINALINDGASADDIEKFKTNRAYQAFIMNNI